MIGLYHELFYCLIVINVSDSLFRGMNDIFPKLKSVTFKNEGVYGSITPKTFEGLQNIETIRFKGTNIQAIEIGSFQNLMNVKGIL